MGATPIIVAIPEQKIHHLSYVEFDDYSIIYLFIYLYTIFIQGNHLDDGLLK